jgi:hypothetical protein
MKLRKYMIFIFKGESSGLYILRKKSGLFFLRANGLRLAWGVCVFVFQFRFEFQAMLIFLYRANWIE